MCKMKDEEIYLKKEEIEIRGEEGGREEEEEEDKKKGGDLGEDLVGTWRSRLWEFFYFGCRLSSTTIPTSE